jgi:hypothetical protein
MNKRSLREFVIWILIARGCPIRANVILNEVKNLL